MSSSTEYIGVHPSWTYLVIVDKDDDNRLSAHLLNGIQVSQRVNLV